MRGADERRKNRCKFLKHALLFMKATWMLRAVGCGEVCVETILTVGRETFKEDKFLLNSMHYVYPVVFMNKKLFISNEFVIFCVV